MNYADIIVNRFIDVLVNNAENPVKLTVTGDWEFTFDSGHRAVVVRAGERRTPGTVEVRREGRVLCVESVLFPDRPALVDDAVVEAQAWIG